MCNFSDLAFAKDRIVVIIGGSYEGSGALCALVEMITETFVVRRNMHGINTKQGVLILWIIRI